MKALVGKGAVARSQTKPKGLERKEPKRERCKWFRKRVRWVKRHCCYDQGPTRDNPCACCYLTVGASAKIAAVVSSWLNSMKVIYYWIWMTNHKNSELGYKRQLFSQHYVTQWAAVALLLVVNLFSILLYRGVYRFKSHICFPWVIVTSVNLFHEFFLITAYSIYYHKTGRVTDLVILLHALISTLVLSYLLWIVIVFLRLLRQDRLGPSALPDLNKVPDPHRYNAASQFHSHRYCAINSRIREKR